MRSLGYAAATFASAEDFLESDRVDGTSCLITDVQMPGLSGVELQSRLIADGRSMPIIGGHGISGGKHSDADAKGRSNWLPEQAL